MRSFTIVMVLFIWTWTWTASAEEEFHTFTDIFGQKTEARILKVEGRQVFLEERDGGKLNLSLKSLPEEEQKLVRAWLTTVNATPSRPKEKRKTNPPIPILPKKSKPQKENSQGNPQWAPGEKALFDQYQKLRSRSQYEEAILVALDWFELCKNHYGREHVRIAASLNNLAVLHREIEQFDEAEDFYKEAVEIMASVQGPDHPSTADMVGNLGALYTAMGRFEDAGKLLERTLRIKEAAHGPNHPLITRTTANLASLHEELGNYQKAKDYLNRTLEIRMAAHEANHPLVAITMANLASLLVRMGSYEEAKSHFERALKIKENVFGPEHSSTATTVANIANLFGKMARYKEAEEYSMRAIKAFEAIHGRDHPTTARAVAGMADILQKMGRFEEAEEYYHRAIETFETVHGPDHSTTAMVIGNLASLYMKMGRFEEAERIHDRTLKIKEAVYGRNHPKTAVTIGNIAALFVEVGNYRKAEQYFAIELEIWEATHGPVHPSTASALGNLAALYYKMGDVEKAEEFYRRALAIRDTVYGPDHPDTASTLADLALLSQKQGRYQEAEQFYQRGLEIQETALGSDHPTTATTLSNLASLYQDLGRYEEAERHFERALKIKIAVQGTDHPDTASTLNNMAILFYEKGRYEEAEQHFKQALEIRESVLGPDHPDTATSSGNLGLVLESAGKLEESLRCFRRQAQAAEKILAGVLSFTTEQERIQFHFGGGEQTYERFASLGAPGETALSLLRNKGIVLESLLEDRLAAEAARDNPDVNRLLRFIAAGKKQLRRAELDKETPRSRTEELRKALTTNQKALARTVTRFGEARRSLSIETEQVQSALNEEAALIEYFHYMKNVGKGRGLRCIGAVILRASGEPALAQCGGAEEIEGTIAKYRKAIEVMDEAGLKEASRNLQLALINPLLPHLERIDQLIISPDGQLNFVSFATFLDESERFLSEDFEIRYAASGRDLPKELEIFADGPPFLVGGPAFSGELPANKDLAADRPELRTQSHPKMRNANADTDLESLKLAPLPGAKEEAERVQAALGRAGEKAGIYSGIKATEAAVRKTKSPRVLHLATHGFFLKEIEIGGEMDELQSSMEIRGGAWDETRGPIANPMYRSGIALAGAQTTIEKWRRGIVPDPDTDGILMAAEVGDLDLRGTDLVTLSACSTGIGEILSGEGVLGLRRGFVMAGARNLLMTLWPVADEDTADFMEDFYTRYAATGNAPKSLTDVQREWLVRLREEKGLVHAVNRAGPFIMSSQGQVK